MKKILSLLMVFTLVITVTACKNTKNIVSEQNISVPEESINTEKGENTESISATTDSDVISDNTSSNYETINSELSQSTDSSGNITNSKTEVDANILQCPDFVGKKVDKIIDEYGKIFKLQIEWNRNNQYDYGTVCEQSVKAGSNIKKGDEILLYTSMGAPTVKVPDVYGKAEADAISELKSKGFRVKVENINSSVEKGYVVKTEPLRATVVKENGEIKLYVSTGVPDSSESKTEETNGDKNSWSFYCEYCGVYLGTVGNLKESLSKSKVCSVCNKKMNDEYLYKNGILDQI